MSISTLGTLFQFIGGLGMFLYGMESMADGLQKFAGNRLQRVLEILTSNRLLGVLVGAGVTAIIQSSSATTVMVVGFVNAGIINLLQATGIIMGALHRFSSVSAHSSRCLRRATRKKRVPKS